MREEQILRDYAAQRIGWMEAINKLKDCGHSRIDAEKLLTGQRILVR